METLGDLGEFGLIDRLTRLLPTAPSVVEAIGDDCAVLRAGDRLLLASCDLSIEDVHFRRATARPYDIGWKAAVASLSDIAAMGGVPTFSLASLACSGNCEAEFLDELYKGLSEAMARHGSILVGGDTSLSHDRLVLDVIVMGETLEGRYLTRGGAQPGDVLAITGRPGLSASGLHALEHGEDTPELARAHRRPEPRIREGQWLAAHADVHALIDVSDGLVQDAGHLAEAGKLGVDIEPGRLPVDACLARYCGEHGLNPEHFMLSGGEDYELAFAAREEALDAFRAEFDTGVTAVGRFTDEWLGVKVAGAAPPRAGFDHFG